MKMLKKLIYLGYDKTTIDQCRPNMNKDNMKTLCNVCLLLLAIVAILVIFYSVFDYNYFRNMLCIIAGAICLIIYWIGQYLLKKDLCTNAYTDRLINGLLVLCFLVSIYLGTFAAPNDMAVAPVWMFFFAILIFNRLPVQNFMVLLIAGTFLVVCSGMLKNAHHFQYDIMHSATSIMASLYMSWVKTKMKIDNIKGLLHLETINSAILETVEEQEKEAKVLRYKAEYDELSGFYKKESFEKTVSDLLAKSTLETCHVLMCSDIDNFKNINDSFGHLYGDNVLKDIVHEILVEIDLEGVYGRFGGDEFMVFINDVKDMDLLIHKLSKLEQRSNKTYQDHEIEQHISLSIGIAIYPQDGHTYKELFEIADDHLYENKRNKKLAR